MVTEDLKFVSDGWRHIAELNAADNALMRSYVWGLDLSGSLGGAGGVGGLLMLNSVANGAHFYTYDGNGNVAGLVKATDGTVSQNCEYEPFGKIIRNTGMMAGENRFLFSTKRCDPTTDFELYEYRVRHPDLTWLNRDPLGEAGGRNLTGFVGNDPFNNIDRLGLENLTFWQTFWLGAGNDFGKVANNVADVGRVAVDTVGMAAYSINGNPEDFQPWSMTYQNAFTQEPTMLQANILMGTFKAAVNVPTLGYEYLWEGTYQAADTGDYTQLQNAFAGYAIGGTLTARFKSVKCPPKASTRTAAQEIMDLGQLKGKSAAEIQAKLIEAGYSPVKAKNGGIIWTKSGVDGNTAAVRIDPANLKNIKGYADEVPHVHKEVVPTAKVSNGNYPQKAATTLDDSGNVTTDKKQSHIPGGH